MMRRQSSSSSMSSLPSLSPLSSLLKKQGIQIRRVDNGSNSNESIATNTSSSCTHTAVVVLKKPTTSTALNYFVEDLSRKLLSSLKKEGEHQTTKFDCKDVIKKAIHEAEEAAAEVQDHHQRFILVSDNARVFANSRPKQQQQQQQYSLSSNSLHTSSSTMTSQRSVSCSPLTDRNTKKNKKQHDRWVSNCSTTITRSYGTSSGSSRSSRSSSRSISTTSSSAGTAFTTGSGVDSCLNIPKRSVSSSFSASVGIIRKLRKCDSIELTQATIAQYNNHHQNKSSNNSNTRPSYNQRTLSESSDHNLSWDNIKDNISNPPTTTTTTEESTPSAMTSIINDNSNSCSKKYGTTTTTTTTAGRLNNTANCRTRRTCSDRFILLSPEAFESSSDQPAISNSNSSDSNFRRTRSAADAVSKLQRALGDMAPKILSSSSSSGRRRRDNNSKIKQTAAATTRRGRRKTNNQNNNVVSLSSSMSSLPPPKPQPDLQPKQKRRASYDTAPKIAIRVSSIESIQR
jgi:hypothetical protein